MDVWEFGLFVQFKQMIFYTHHVLLQIFESLFTSLSLVCLVDLSEWVYP
jgi:bifunctional DNase/RNase